MTSPEVVIFLATKQIELYNRTPGVYIDTFCNGTVMRRIMSDYYSLMIKRKMVKLENLEEDVKTELKKMAIEFSNGRLSLSGVMDLCKFLHILTYEGTNGK